MLGKWLVTAVSAMALSGAMVAAAHAADPLKPDSAVTLTDRNQWGPQSVHKSFQWDAGKGRWGVKLDFDQPASSRGVAWQDVQAGAYFNVTPSISVGGAVQIRDASTLTNQSNPQGPIALPPNAPRVRLETQFKF
jgi:hypothetical protein